MNYPVRARVSVAIIVLMGLLSLCTMVSYWSVLPRNGSGNEIAMDEARFAGLRPALPARGNIGYLSDIVEPKQSAKAYYLTQYYLAPVVVTGESGHQLAVANFASAAQLADAANAGGFEIQCDLRNGVALLRRRTR
jgi:hypothetical protein